MLYLCIFSREVLRLWLRIMMFGCYCFVLGCCLKKGRRIKLCPYLKQYKLTTKKSSKRSPIYSVGATFQVNVGMMLLKFYHLCLNLWKVMEVKRAALIVYVFRIPSCALVWLPSISVNMKMLHATTQSASKFCKAKKFNYPRRNSRPAMASPLPILCVGCMLPPS